MITTMLDENDINGISQIIRKVLEEKVVLRLRAMGLQLKAMCGKTRSSSYLSGRLKKIHQEMLTKSYLDQKLAKFKERNGL